MHKGKIMEQNSYDYSFLNICLLNIYLFHKRLSLAQVVRDCGLSICGGTENLSGYGPGQPALFDLLNMPLLNRVIALDDLRGSVSI